MDGGDEDEDVSDGEDAERDADKDDLDEKG